MPIDYARTAGAMSDLVSQPVNSFMAARDYAQQNQRRNMLADQVAQRTDITWQQQQDDRQNAMMQQEKAAGQEKLKHALSRIQWALQSGNPKQAVLSDPGIDQQAAQAFSQMSDEQAMQHLQQQQMDIASQLGIGPPEPDKPKDPKIMSAGRDIIRINPETGQAEKIYTAPRDMPQTGPTSDMQNWNFRNSLPPEQRAEWDRMHPTSGPDAGKPPTEADKKVGVLFGSMVTAENNIRKLAGGTDTSSKLNSMVDWPVTRIMQSDDYRKFQSAAKQWSANLLYIKSGATATPEEVQSTYMQFFPQPGDGPQAKAQKDAARQQEIDNIRSGYPQTTGQYKLDPLPAPSEKSNQGSAPSVKSPPASALKEGVVTHFANGQSWTLQGGAPVQVK